MFKHMATVGGIGLAVAFVVVFFIGRTESKHLTEVAPRVGMSYDDRGRRFVCNNSDHLRTYLFDDHYGARNPFSSLPSPLVVQYFQLTNVCAPIK